MSKTAHYYTKFEENQFYHIYNRTVDKHALFCNEGNYTFFLQRYDAYLSPVVDTYAYCLLGNHFHLLVRIRSMEELTAFLDSEAKAKNLLNTQKNLSTLYPEDLTTFQKLSNLSKTPHEIVSHQFQKFFQSYAMAFNKQQSRVGTLFQTPFKRVLVNSDTYFRQLVYYIHSNPTHHNEQLDFREWKWSSYQRILMERESKLQKAALIDWFGNKEGFILFHANKQQQLADKDIYMEDD